MRDLHQELQMLEASILEVESKLANYREIMSTPYRVGVEPERSGQYFRDMAHRLEQLCLNREQLAALHDRTRV